MLINKIEPDIFSSKKLGGLHDGKCNISLARPNEICYIFKCCFTILNGLYPFLTFLSSRRLQNQWMFKGASDFYGVVNFSQLLHSIYSSQWKTSLEFFLIRKDHHLIINIQELFRALSPKSDQHLISPYKINQKSHFTVTRIMEMITKTSS